MCNSHPAVIDLKVGSMKAVILAKAGILQKSAKDCGQAAMTKS